MGVLEREYMKEAQEQKTLPRLIVIGEKQTGPKWVKRMIYFLCGLIATMIILRLLKEV